MPRLELLYSLISYHVVINVSATRHFGVSLTGEAMSIQAHATGFNAYEF